MNVLRRAVLAMSLCAVAPCTVPATAQESSRFESAAARFSLTRPAGWSFVSHEGDTDLRLSEEDLKQVDEEIRKKVEHVVLPLPVVTISKTGASSEGVVAVFLAPLQPALTGAAPGKVLDVFFASTKKLFPDLTLERPVRELEVSGRPAAEYMATYTLRTNDGITPTRAGLIVVPRGKSVFVITLIAVPPGDKQYVEDFAKIVSSIAIGD